MQEYNTFELITFRYYPEMPQVLDTLERESKEWFFASVGLLVTHQREYVALHKVAASGVSPCGNEI